MKESRTIGILGGGQLAKMLCDSGKKMGHKTLILDPNPDSCGQLSSFNHIVAQYDDKKELKKLAEATDVITYEFENVPNEIIDYLKENNGNVPQGKRPLYLSQHRIREKEAVNKIGVKTAKFQKIENFEDLEKGIKEMGFPCILKTCSGGYDGKGQWKITEEEDLKQVDIKFGIEYILEKMVYFDKEVSCLVVRGINGDIVSFPVGENIHKNGILNKTIVPARVTKEISKKIEELSKNIIEGLDIYGPLGIEYFIKGDEIFFNEMAPRPHNSAHYTMDACNYSQFDIHLMGILGEKLPEIKLLKSVVMLNIMGEDRGKVEKLKQEDNSKVHIYGKTEWKKDRKMGHINYCGENIEELIVKANSF
ncbi:5-(carboxyamino)imidazole ribonucleotide synthase [Cetobacterium somerae]|uniref:5-(carboxyamino)imidazole ribonucleotide synthase n=1 Tax=Cetobacterium somerae TaxID=188913 RepID=UPI003D76A00A